VIVADAIYMTLIVSAMIFTVMIFTAVILDTEHEIHRLGYAYFHMSSVMCSHWRNGLRQRNDEFILTYAVCTHVIVSGLIFTDVLLSRCNPLCCAIHIL